MSSSNTTPGYVNPNNQRVVRATGDQGTDNNQKVIEMECLDCGFHHGTNGTNCHQCKCINPNGQGQLCGTGNHENLL